MKLTINEKACLKHKLTMDEILVALMYRQVKNFDKTYENLLNREVLVCKEGKTFVTQRWSDEIDEILCDSTGNVTYSDEDLTALALKMQAVYPKGKMFDNVHCYQSNKKEIANKLKKFFVEYGEYSEEEILDATKRYVASFMGNYRFMKALNNFVWKMDKEDDEEGNTHNVRHSSLADYLENKESEEDGTYGIRDTTTRVL